VSTRQKEHRHTKGTQENDGNTGTAWNLHSQYTTKMKYKMEYENKKNGIGQKDQLHSRRQVKKIQ
jgi:hypothetical protein